MVSSWLEKLLPDVIDALNGVFQVLCSSPPMAWWLWLLTRTRPARKRGVLIGSCLGMQVFRHRNE